MAHTFYTLGIMSGTSADGIDTALVLHNNDQDHLVLHEQHSYPPKTRQAVHDLIKTQTTSLAKLTAAHYLVGQAFADAAAKTIEFARKKKFLKAKDSLRAIGSHGQTVFHHPETKRTLQIGEASLIAAATGITTVSDFRMADTAVGGEGAPLLPAYHKRLLKAEAKRGIAVHNLGGISNFTYLGPKNTIFALDTGPANCLLDVAIQRLSHGKMTFDESGKIAAGGNVNDAQLDWLLRQPGVPEFLARPAPKSTGRELFTVALTEAFLERNREISENDVMATLTEFSVELMKRAYHRFVIGKNLPLREIIFCGGGVQNEFLLSRVQAVLPELDIRTMEDYGWNSQALEAQAFGYFAACALDGTPITLPATTGCKVPAVCGKISPGAGWEKN